MEEDDNSIIVNKFVYLKLNCLNSSDFFLIKKLFNVNFGIDDKKFLSYLHYNKEITISNFLENFKMNNIYDISLINELIASNKLSECDNVIKLFEVLSSEDINVQEVPKKLFMLFYIRLSIEKFCLSNANNQYIDDTKKIINYSNIELEIKEKIIKICNNIPMFVHINFFEPSFLIDLNINHLKSLQNELFVIISKQENINEK